MFINLILLIVVDKKSDLGAIRTRDPQLRRLLLYPTELRDHFIVIFWQI